ncbi:hypothetical protein DLREEDagr8_48540 [Dongia sp. agr-C8]
MAATRAVAEAVAAVPGAGSATRVMRVLRLHPNKRPAKANSDEAAQAGLPKSGFGPLPKD